jgi:hypothetical protein
MSQQDDLYQEGLILSDYVINEFSHSPIVLRILNGNTPLRDKVLSKLRDELTDYREQCLNALRLCEFVDKTGPSDPPRPVIIPPSPTEVSRSSLMALMARPLEEHKLGRQPITPSSSSHALSISVPPSAERSVGSLGSSPEPSQSSKSSVLARSGLFSGLTVEAESSEAEDNSVVLRLKPERILESAFPVEIYGVLDGQHVHMRPSSSTNTRKRKRKRALTDGILSKEGNYNALAYGGFVHLCGGALEWPFRTADIRFSDFFRNSKQEAKSEDLSPE